MKYNENTTCARASKPSALDTCGSLYPSVVLRIAGWVIGMSSLVGNLSVMLLRLHSQQSKSKVQNILTINLAIADCLMGAYMIIITSTDVYFGGNYFLSAPQWRESTLCKFSSFLAFISSESSVFTLTLITVDRFICIAFPFGKIKFTPKFSIVAVLLVWAVTIGMGLLPIFLGPKISGFYSTSDVCIGLPLHVETGETGRLEFIGEYVANGASDFIVEYVPTDSKRTFWIFSIITFIGINMFLFVSIMVCYILMFIAVKRSSQTARNTASRDRDIKVARKMAVIVGTDFLCWMPIIVMGLLTQTGWVILPPSLYAWCVIFILPINSSLNPILYTFVVYLEARKKSNAKANATTTTKAPSAKVKKIQLSNLKESCTDQTDLDRKPSTTQN